MKALRMIAAACCCIALLACNAQAQGGLVPSGAPNPTMKTLEQIEPRIPISALPYAIANSGSYYLTTNVAAASGTGITIGAGNVTLDLGGFTLAGAAGTGDGILVAGSQTNIWIGTGTISGWDGAGVNAASATASVFSGLRLVGNGGWGLNAGEHATVQSCTAVGKKDFLNGGIHADIHALIQDCLATFNRWGIQASGGATVRDCVAINNSDQGMEVGDASTVQGCTSRDNGTEGIFAGAGVSIEGCAATANGGYGFRSGDAAVIAGCTARSNKRGIVAGSGAAIKDCSAFNSSEIGIEAGVNASVVGCSAMDNGWSGISAGVGSTVADCSARSNNEGILAGTGSMVRHCTALYNYLGISVPNNCHLLDNNCGGNSGHGIVVGLDRNRIEGNNLTDNAQYGLNVVYPGNIVLRNTARGNGFGNYNIVPTNTVGQILDFSAGGGIVSNANPWANFSY